MKQCQEQMSLFSAEASLDHASLLVLPGSEEAVKMTVTSGLKCLELYRKYGPLGSLVRMLLGSSQWHSTQCYLTWKISATPSKRLLFRLAARTPRTKEKDALFWPTPTTDSATTRKKRYAQGGLPLSAAVQMWPTPRVGGSKGKSQSGVKHGDLAAVVALYATPQARDYRTGQESRWNDPKRSRNLNDQIGGQLNPDWVCAMMGFPSGWLNVEEDGQMEHGKTESQE